MASRSFPPISELTEAAVGRSVTYTPFPGCDADQLEFGVITSFNDRFVFVRYGAHLHSQATDPKDLSW